MIGNKIVESIQNAIKSSQQSVEVDLSTNVDSDEASKIVDITSKINEQTEANNGLTESVEKVTDATVSQVAAQETSNITKQVSNDTTKQGTISTIANTAATTANTVAQKAWNVAKSVGIGLLKTTITFLAAMVATKFLTWIIDVAQAQEKLTEATQESVNAYKEVTTSVDDYVSKYQELREALIAAKGNEEETYNVKKQLLELQTELNEKFGEEYGRINLVTEAYKNQTEAIKAYNKEAANEFLNENEEGIRLATRKMTNDNHYNLSYTGISSASDEGQALREIAERYAEQGVEILEGDAGGTFSIHLYADAESAYDTINDFESDVREKAKELGDEHLFDDVLDISSKSLDDAKSIIDEYGDIYKQSLLANIATDDDLSEGYNKAIEAVEAYNEAVLKAEDPYSDESVLKARRNLQSIQDELTGEDWEKYASVVKEVFEEANTGLYDFNKELQSDSTLRSYAEDLKGLSDLDLKSLDVGDNESFDKLREAAEAYGVSVEELIDALVRLGDVQGEIQTVADNEITLWGYSETIKQLDTVQEKLNVLDQSYAKLFDPDEQIGFEDLSSIYDAFSDLDNIDEYIKRIQEAGQNTEAVTSVMEELITSYLQTSGVLDNVTSENADLIASMLQEMGIANAQELVNYALAESESEVAAQKILNANASLDLANLTAVEIQELMNEAGQSELTKQKLAELLLQKQLCNRTAIMTDGDIQNLQALAEQAGATAKAVAAAKQMATEMQTAGAGRLYSNNPDKAQKKYQQIYDSLIDDISNQAKLNYTQAVNNGGSTPVKYTGGSNTSNAIEQAAKDAESAAKDAQDAFEETFDFFERRVKVLEDAFGNLESAIENVIGAEAKNTLLSQQIGILDEEVNNYTDALAMYRAKADEALSGIDSTLRDKIVNGAVSLTDFVGDGNEEVVQAMEDYQGWADKVAECTQKLEELKTQIRQLELEKFNNIVEDFTNQFDLFGDSIDLIDQQIGLLEEAGQLIGENFYQAQIDQTQKQLSTLEAERDRLVDQLNESLSSGRIQQGTDEWLEMVNALTDVESSILDCKTSIEEFDNALLELHWEIFDRVQTEFGNIADELDNLSGLFDDYNDIAVSDGEGTWTDQAIATLGLYAQQYELAKYQVQQYSEAIDQLNYDYKNGKYSTAEYMDKLAELNQSQWDAVNSAEAIEDAIISLNEARVNEEIETIEEAIDAYKEYTDAQIEAIEAAEDLRDMQDTLAEKTKAVADLERQIAAMQNDDTASTVAQRKLLEEQLAEARKDLADTEHDYEVESKKDALNKNYEAYEEARNAEIEALQETLKNRELLISQSFETVKTNASLVGEQIALIAQEHGIVVSNAVITPWQNGSNAIAEYGSVLTTQSSAFIAQLTNVEGYVYNLQNQANVTAQSLAYMFSTRADNLVSQLIASYNSEANLANMTNALQNSLINTLERGYDISSITNALSSITSGANSVASAANSAADALSRMGMAQSAATDLGSENRTKYRIVDTKYGRTIESDLTYQEAKQNLYTKYRDTSKYLTIMRMTKGGIITKDDNNPLNEIAKSVGEDVLIAAKDQESVLTPIQTQGLLKLAPMLENLSSGIIPKVNVPDYINNKLTNSGVELNCKSLFEFNGDFNNTDQLLAAMEGAGTKAAEKLLNRINRNFKV